MAKNMIFSTRKKERVDTEANWIKHDPILLKGELAFSSDKKNMYKLGDGTSKWSELSYTSVTITSEEIINALGYEPPEANTWRPMAYDLDTDDNTKSLSADLGPVIKKSIEEKLGKTDVSDWAKAKTKPSYTASEVGLGNVGNYKAVSTVSSQGLTDTEKSNARANIGAQAAGSYASSSHKHTKSEITDFPTSMPANGGNADTVNGHTVESDVPANAKFTDTTYSKLSQFTDDVGYVKDTDSRLTDSRNAKDVYDWAKAKTKPSYTASEVGLGNVGNYKAVSTVSSQGLTDTEKSNARANIGAGTSSFDGNYNSLSNKPTIPTKTSQLTNDSGYKTTDNNTTYTLTQDSTDGHKITLTSSSGTTMTVTIPDNNTTYGDATTSSHGLMTSAMVSKLSGIADGANKTIVDSALSSTSTNPVQNKVINSALSGKANTSHKHNSADINSLDASKLTGTIDIARLPQGALDRLVRVADDTARFALTTSDIQLGDTVQTTNNGKMYYVVDESKLSSTDGYAPYTADSATSVPWSGVTGKPSSYTPSSHTHTKSQITDFPSTLPANGGNSTTVNGHTVNSDVPAGAKFTDTWRPVETTLTNQDLNSITTSGFYSAGGVNSVTNKPSEVNHFGLVVIHRASGSYYTQIIFNDTKSWRRHCVASTWGDWNEEKLTDTNTWRPQPDWDATSGDAMIKNKPTIPSVGNGTVTITQNGTSKGTFTMNQSGNTTITLTDTDTNTTYDVATTSSNGLMSKDMVTKLNGIAAGATAVSDTTVSGWGYKKTDTNTWRGIQDNLTSTSTTDSLSANQGKILNDKFGSYVPTSRTVNGKGLSANISLSASDVGAATSNHTHSYNDLSNKPTIPTNTNQLTNGAGFITGITKAMVTNALGYTPPTSDTNTWIAFKGATTSADGTAGYAPAPSAGAANRYLRSDGTWSVPPDNNTTYGTATTSANGLMSSTDKSKLDGIASGANKYSHPTYTAKSSGLYKVTVDGTGHVSGTTAVTKADITALGIPGTDTNTTYGTGTSSTSGLTKLYTTTGTATDGTMTQNAIKSALDGKANSSHTHANLDSIGSVGYYGSDVANTSGWYKVYSTTLTGYGNHVARLSLISGFSTIANGIINLHLRCENDSTIYVKRLSWESRQGFSVGDVIINTNGNTWTLYVKQSNYQNGRIKIRVLESLWTAGNWTMTLTSNTTKESSTPTATVTATDGATVNYANSAGSVAWNNVSGKPSTFTPSSHTHTKSQITDFPSSLPANGGNSSTVNGHTVNIDVPSNAKFTDTVYTHPTSSGNKHIPSGGSSGQILRWAADGTAVWGSDNNTTYTTGTSSVLGLTKLYTGTGTATDGTMTQSAITSALSGKAASSHTHSYLPLTGGTVNGAVTFGQNDSYGIFTSTDNYGSIGSSSAYFYRSYIKNMYAITMYSNEFRITGHFSLRPSSSTSTDSEYTDVSNSVWIHGVTSTDYYGANKPGLLLRQGSNFFQVFPVNNSTSTPTDIGHSSYKFRNIVGRTLYSDSGTVSTSDRNLKHDISNLSDEIVEKLVDGLIPKSFKFNDGDSGRTHYGIIAQELEELLISIGIDPNDFAPLVKVWEDKIIKTEHSVIGKDGKLQTIIEDTVEKDTDKEPTYHIRYEEFIMILVQYCQNLKKNINDMQTQLNDIYSRLDEK